jgi:hypothetical protein
MDSLLGIFGLLFVLLISDFIFGDVWVFVSSSLFAYIFF